MKITPQYLLEKKLRGERIVMLTSYDYPTALAEDRSGVDVQLVGDSVGTNMLGYEDITRVTVDDIAHHVSAVARGAKTSFVLGDMPKGSFTDPRLALANSKRLRECGADGVKMEGERDVVAAVAHVAESKIPVCAHIGYTPQTRPGKPTVQGKDINRAIELLEVASELERAGAFMVVLELIAEPLAAEITKRLTIPTIGIGAGRFCDGQVQVVHDVLGLSQRVFKHTKRFAELGKLTDAAICDYAREVRSGIFPQQQHAAGLSAQVAEELQAWLAAHGSSAAAAAR